MERHGQAGHDGERQSRRGEEGPGLVRIGMAWMGMAWQARLG